MADLARVRQDVLLALVDANPEAQSGQVLSATQRQDVASYEDTQETLALLRILASGAREIESRVFIVLIADGRPDMQSLLARRLLASSCDRRRLFAVRGTR